MAVLEKFWLLYEWLSKHGCLREKRIQSNGDTNITLDHHKLCNDYECPVQKNTVNVSVQKFKNVLQKFKSRISEESY